ncbi:MAG: hypothetical protein SGILL_004617, partial [Bacillariaceae sp.]
QQNHSPTMDLQQLTEKEAEKTKEVDDLEKKPSSKKRASKKSVKKKSKKKSLDDDSTEKKPPPQTTISGDDSAEEEVEKKLKKSSKKEDAEKKLKKSSKKKSKKSLDEIEKTPGAVAVSKAVEARTVDHAELEAQMREKIDLETQEKYNDIPLAEAVAAKNDEDITCTFKKKYLWWVGAAVVVFALVLGLALGLRDNKEQSEVSNSPPYHHDDNHYYDDYYYEDDYYENYPASTPTAMPVEFVPTEAPKTSEELCTSAECQFSYEELQLALESGAPVVALCGDVSIDSDPIIVNRDGVTLVGCCDARKCVIEGSGNTRNLVVTGAAFTLQNLALVGGRCNNPINGGGANFQYSGAGPLNVIDSELRDGSCGSEGGNLYAEARNGDVYLKGSRFDGGDGWLVGGALVYDARDTYVIDCEFLNSRGSGLGRYLGSGRSLNVNSSKFVNNVAEYGGMFVSHFGDMPKIAVWNTIFEDNTGSEVGGAFSYTGGPLSRFEWTGNAGQGNDGRQCEDAFLTNDGGVCYKVDAEILP